MFLFIAGAVSVSVVWFFVIRNNRKNFDKAFDELQAKYDNALNSQKTNAAAQKPA